VVGKLAFGGMGISLLGTVRGDFATRLAGPACATTSGGASITSTA
jgi:hypothetical protein